MKVWVVFGGEATDKVAPAWVEGICLKEEEAEELAEKSRRRWSDRPNAVIHIEDFDINLPLYPPIELQTEHTARIGAEIVQTLAIWAAFEAPGELRLGDVQRLREVILNVFGEAGTKLRREIEHLVGGKSSE